MTDQPEHSAESHVTILYPRFTHEAIEERYATAHAQLLLRRAAPEADWLFYEDDEELRDVVLDVETPFCLVVTDPLLLAAAGIAGALLSALQSSEAFASVPVANESSSQEQRAAPPRAYLTVRQFSEVAAAVRQSPLGDRQVVRWSGDPGIYLTRTASIQREKRTAREAIAGNAVVVSGGAWVHRWPPLRAQLRVDLLERIPVDARSILEFGCGEALLGEALKKRQRCRVVGIELDNQAAAAARRRIDDLYVGDVRHLVTLINEEFDWIIGGDIVEHLDDPWAFLRDLRRIAAPGGSLLLSIPNIANWAVVSDLLRGRFDYSYISITCAGHLRFFTRETIRDALLISGWSVAAIDPQPAILTAEFEELEARLIASGIPHSREDLVTPGYYVTALNDHV